MPSLPFKTVFFAQHVGIVNFFFWSDRRKMVT